MEDQPRELTGDEILQMQFTKVGQLVFQLEVAHQELARVKAENEQLKEQLKGRE